MASKKTPAPADEKTVPETGETGTPPASPPPPPPAGAPPKRETLVLQDRLGDLAIGRVVSATEDQAKTLRAAGRARNATRAQIAQAGRVPTLPADFS